MNAAPEQNVKAIVDATMKARERKVLMYSLLNSHYLAGHSDSLEIYGEDAALDFVETKWPKLFARLLELADAKQTSTTVNLPGGGDRAQATILDFLQASLPGCEFSIAGVSMDISWAKLVAQSKKKIE